MLSDRPSPAAAQRQFVADLAAARSEAALFEALYQYSTALVPVRLWTIMTVDMAAGVARRAYSNMPDAYPTSGTKPIERNSWFEIVHDRHESFVANTLDDIAQVFPDHALIGSLGCASVLNLPVVSGGTLRATVNLLDEAGHFTPTRVDEITNILALPAFAAIMAAQTR